jgi:ribosomal protein L37E
MARLAALSQFSLLVALASFSLLPPPVLPGALLHRGRRQAEDVNTKDIKIDVVEADVEIDGAEAEVVNEETIGDKQMDATAIDDDAAEVVEEKEDAIEKDGEMEHEKVIVEKEEVVENNKDNENEHSEVVEEDGEAVEVDDEEEEESDPGVPDTLDRCHKCLKASFKFKKEFYCLKCVKHGIIKENEASPVHCRKCRKKSYRTKNEEFCKSKCTVETAMELLEEDVLEDILEEILEEEETTTMTATTTTTPDLGLLGNIFKFIVEKTTFGVPSATASETV